MKKYILGSIILLSVVGAVVLSLWYTRSAIRETSELIDLAAGYTESGDIKSAESVLWQVDKSFERCGNILSTYIAHEQIDAVRVYLRRALKAAERQDEKECMLLLSEIKIRLEVIEDDERILLKNIL